MSKQKHGWFRVAALAVGLVGTAIGVAAVVKKQKEQSERIQFDSFEDELLMDAAEAEEAVDAAMMDMNDGFEGSAEVVSQTKPLDEIGVLDDEDDDEEDSAMETDETIAAEKKKD